MLARYSVAKSPVFLQKRDITPWNMNLHVEPLQKTWYYPLERGGLASKCAWASFEK